MHAPDQTDVHRRIETVWRMESARIVAALSRLLRDVGLAEELAQDALVAALQAGRIAGAGLDVFADEPRVPEALIGMENVVLSPHQASATEETRRRMADLVVSNLERHFSKEEGSAT